MRVIEAVPITLVAALLVMEHGPVRGLMTLWGFLAVLGGASLLADAVLLIARVWLPTTAMPYLTLRLVGTGGFHTVVLVQGNTSVAHVVLLFSAAVGVVLGAVLGFRLWLTRRRNGSRGGRSELQFRGRDLSLTLGIAGIAGAWGSLLIALLRAYPDDPPASAFFKVSVVMLVAFVVHVVGTGAALLSGPGRSTAGLVVNLAGLTVIVALFAATLLLSASVLPPPAPGAD